MSAHIRVMIIKIVKDVTTGSVQNKLLATISAAVVQAMKTAGITALPANDTDAAALHNAVKNVAGYTGSAKTTVETQSHLDASLSAEFKTIVRNKTLYTFDFGDMNSISLLKLVVNTDLTAISSEILYGNNVGSKVTKSITFQGNTVYSNGDTKGKTYVGRTADYLIFKNQSGNENRLYFDQAKAQAYVDSLPALSGTVTYNGSTYTPEKAHLNMDQNTIKNLQINIIEFRVNNSGRWAQFTTSYTSKAAFDAALPVGVPTTIAGSFASLSGGITNLGQSAIFTKNSNGTYNFSASNGGNSISMLNVVFDNMNGY